MTPRRRYVETPDGVEDAPVSQIDLDEFDAECDRAYEDRRQREIDDDT